MILTFSTCQEKKKNFMISLDDSIKQAILDYIKENDINLDSRIITTDWVANPYRTDIYISNSLHQFDEGSAQLPTYYSIVYDSIVVFVYSGVERSVDRDTRELYSELMDILAETNVKLAPDRGNIVHSNTWLFTVCGEASQIIRRPSTSDLFYIPCRGVLMSDTLVNDGTIN